MLNGRARYKPYPDRMEGLLDLLQHDGPKVAPDKAEEVALQLLQDHEYMEKLIEEFPHLSHKLHFNVYIQNSQFKLRLEDVEAAIKEGLWVMVVRLLPDVQSGLI